jgi:hypothetical protein
MNEAIGEVWKGSNVVYQVCMSIQLAKIDGGTNFINSDCKLQNCYQKSVTRKNGILWESCYEKLEVKRTIDSWNSSKMFLDESPTWGYHLNPELPNRPSYRPSRCAKTSPLLPEV